MSERVAGPEERFTAIAEELLTLAGVTQTASVYDARPGFGSSALKVGGRIFAMLVRGGLVVKLPSRRVEELVAAGAGERFDPGHGRPMREWLAVAPSAAEDWLALVHEAREFVAALA
ncbi:hypothetical protein HNP84_006046 [Thermocatellispora tengchongensis]|uniref:TfoX N-terminal domain-containing protein n=1 Tax=Thermocatellispora tengchongensis TaxID=1073253 RepID=A0A840PBC2_9ACTN|nr:TfoX/Sxy family protein [Thermocatellispora tengchongensis]MBB5136299.1 hypothetical protein [Thermocatellispora tengchongensis]